REPSAHQQGHPALAVGPPVGPGRGAPPGGGVGALGYDRLSRMPRANETIEALLQEYSDLLSMSGGDPFRVRTYEKAARSVGGYHVDVSTLDLQGLQEIANVGASTAEKIQEYFERGLINALEELRVKIPAGVRQMISIPGLG